MAEQEKTVTDLGFKLDERTSRLIGEDVWVGDESAWIIKKGRGQRNAGCYLRRGDGHPAFGDTDGLWFSSPEEAAKYANAIEEYANQVGVVAVRQASAKRADGQGTSKPVSGGQKLQA